MAQLAWDGACRAMRTWDAWDSEVGSGGALEHWLEQLRLCNLAVDRLVSWLWWCVRVCVCVCVCVLASIRTLEPRVYVTSRWQHIHAYTSHINARHTRRCEGRREQGVGGRGGEVDTTSRRSRLTYLDIPRASVEITDVVVVPCSEHKSHLHLVIELGPDVLHHRPSCAGSRAEGVWVRVC
jgi:hypothetical protein